jgi:uncharacterized protein YehS (DUF1456 family)
MKLNEKVEQLSNQRANTLARAQKLQEALQQAFQELNQLDGAIQILNDLIMEEKTNDEQQPQPEMD